MLLGNMLLIAFFLYCITETDFGNLNLANITTALVSYTSIMVIIPFSFIHFTTDYPNCGLKQCEHYRSGSNCYCKSGYKLLSDGRSCEGNTD